MGDYTQDFNVPLNKGLFFSRDFLPSFRVHSLFLLTCLDFSRCRWRCKVFKRGTEKPGWALQAHLLPEKPVFQKTKVVLLGPSAYKLRNWIILLFFAVSDLWVETPGYHGSLRQKLVVQILCSFVKAVHPSFLQPFPPVAGRFPRHSFKLSFLHTSLSRHLSA